MCLSSGLQPSLRECVCQHLRVCAALFAARKAFPIFSNWVHCLALLSPDCGSVLFPIGGTLSLNSDYVNDLSSLLYSSLLLFTTSSQFTDGLYK